MTIRSAVAAAAQKLNTTSDAPHLDAERLLLYVLGEAEISFLYTHGEKELSAQQTERLEALVARRATGEPLAYILGEWEFYGRPFFVTPDVLIPRPETEDLVEAALNYLQPSLKLRPAGTHPFVIADIGTGSGVIAITLALELNAFPSLRRRGALQGGVVIIATDISSAALAVARKNAERHGVADQIEFREGDMLSPFDFASPSGDRQGKPPIDLIVSNPPYLPSQELDESHFAKTTRDKSETIGLRFEPKLALDGGPDGQKFVEQIKNAGIPALVESTNGEVISFIPR